MEVILISNGQPQDTITAVQSFEVSFKLDILDEGYLGETTNRKDSVFKGVSGRMDLHLENASIFTLAAAIIDKARRRVPGARINVKATLNFPNGQRPRVIIPDVEFGALPLNFGSRTDYGKVTLEFEAAEAQVIT